MRSIGTVIGVFLASLMLVASSVCQWTATRPVEAPPSVYYGGTTQDATEPVVVGWLESQRKGQDGFEFWHKRDCVRPFSLYAVSSYEIVDRPTIGHRTVRIHSATRGSQPVVKLYKFTVTNGKLMSVEAQGEDQ